MKNLYNKLVGGSLFLLCSFFATAQSTANYSFATNTTGSLTDMSSGTTQLLAANIDDTPSPLTTIGFDFFFQGARYIQFSVNENGVLRLGASAQASTPYKPLAQAGSAIITAYGADQRTHAVDGKVHYKITGAAPARVLVVEWLNNQANFDVGGTADLTYQVRLYETTGVIEFVYGSMTMSTPGAASVDSRDPNIGFSSSNLANTVGSVTAAQTGTPAPTYNGSSAIPVANLYTVGPITVLSSAVNGSRRVFTFTPPVPAAATGLNFTAITGLGMTLNWTDNAVNEIIYAVYRSDDAGITYNFVSQVAANAVSSVQSGLAPGTNYSWRVFAVTEGALSAALQGSQSTTPAGNISSNGTGGGLWSLPATWTGGVVPTATDNVTIKNGDVVTIDIAANAYTLTVGGGISGTLQYETVTARTLTVNSNVSIATGGTITSGAGSLTTHVLSTGGNITNSGTLNLASGTSGAGLTFTGSANSTFTGTGAVNNLFTILLSKSSIAQIVDVNLTNFSVRGLSVAAPGALLTSGTGTGTLKFSGTNSFSGTLWSAAAYTIPATFGLWLNNPNFTVTGLNGIAAVSGLFRMTQGTYNIGTATGNALGFNAGSTIIVEGGTINSTGRFAVAAATNAITYNQSGGTITVCTIGNASTTLANFDLGTAAASSVSISGGTIINQLANTAASGPRDYRNQAGVLGITGTTGGTLQLGNAASGAAKAFSIAGVVPNLVINNTSAGHSATFLAPAVFNNISLNITINTGTTLNIGNNVFLFFGTTLTNNGTLTANGASSNFVTFLTTSPQTYTGTGTVTAPMTNLGIQSNLNFIIDPASANIVVGAVRLFYGSIINSNKLTIGNGGATTGIIQIGNTTTPTAAGTFDLPPVFNAGTGGITLSYLRTTAARNTGPEVPPSRTVSALTINENDPAHPLTLTGGDLTVTGTYTQTAGDIILGSNTLILGTSAVAAGTYTYTAGILIGKFKRWITAATGNRDFPVGIASVKRNASINFTTAPATGGTLTTEWILGWGGNNGLPLTEGAINVNTTSHNGYWRIVAGDGLAGGNYTGTFTATGIAGVNDFTQLVLLKRVNGASPWVQDGIHVTSTGSNAVPVISRTGMTGFSEFGIGGDALINPLPVTLLSFTAQRNGPANVIKWATSQEINTSQFALERSSNGHDFTTIAQLAAAGNSSTIRNYSYTDNNPLKAINYYRLRIVDIDNNARYSTIITVNNSGATDVTVYPNPVKDILTVTINADKAGKGNMVISDLNGKVVYKRTISIAQGKNDIPVDLSNVAGAVYIIKVQLDDAVVVKQFNKL